jgi:hypothetical protein
MLSCILVPNDDYAVTREVGKSRSIPLFTPSHTGTGFPSPFSFFSFPLLSLSLSSPTSPLSSQIQREALKAGARAATVVAVASRGSCREPWRRGRRWHGGGGGGMEVAWRRQGEAAAYYCVKKLLLPEFFILDEKIFFKFVLKISLLNFSHQFFFSL